MIADVKETFDRVVLELEQAVERIKHTMDFEWSIPRPKIPKITWTYDTVHSGDGSSYQIPQFDVHWYANGGFPEDGLFYANHGELVGKFSNGKTAVANNEQITEGIATAVYGAFVRAYSETGNTNKGSKVAVLNVNGREFARAIFDDTKAVEREHGISLITA